MNDFREVFSRRRRWLIGCVDLLMIALVVTSCALLGKDSRLGTAEIAAQVDAQVRAALMEIKNELHASIDTTMTARVGDIGDEIGGDNTESTVDSWTSVTLAGGLIVGLLMLLARVGDAKTAKTLIQGLEPARERRPCDCGKCADCIVARLPRSGWVGRALHKRVKRWTPRRSKFEIKQEV